MIPSMVKIFIAFLLSLTVLLLPAFSYLVLDNNFACANLEVKVEIFNETEYEERDEIERDLCKEDEDPEEDRCSEFTDLSDLEYKIYGGPLRGLGVVQEGKISSENTISFSASEPRKYLLEIELPEGSSSTYFEDFIEVDPCPYLNLESESEENVTVLNNLSFKLDSGVSILIQETNLTNSTNIDFTLSVPLSDFSEVPENSIQGFSFEVEDGYTYESLSLQVPLPLDNLSEMDLFFSQTGESWEEFEEFSINDDLLNLNLSQSGYFMITSQPTEPEQPSEESEEELLNPETTPTVQEMREDGMSPLTLIVIGLLILFIIVSFFIFSGSNKGKNNKTSLLEEASALELVPSYRKEIENASKYIKDHKDNFPKDSLIKELRTAGYHEDVISKAISKEYE